MLWIKRNLFLAIGGLAALLVMGGGGFVLYSGMQKNKEVQAELEEKLAERDRIYRMNPFPSRENIEAAEKELVRLEEAVGATKKFFTPVPFQNVSNLAFKTLLDNSIAQLQQQAAQANVTLPEKDYAFSFKAEKEALSLPAVSFPTLPMQLAEVELICRILFDAKINRLESLRRPRVTGTEDISKTDHHDLAPMTNAATKIITTPYELSFCAFSQNLAEILENFYKSPHGLVAKVVLVSEGCGPTDSGERRTVPSRFSGVPEGAPRRVMPPPTFAGEAEAFPEGRVPPRSPGMRRGLPTRGMRPPRGAPGGGAPEGLETVLDEQLLKVTLLVYVMKPGGS